jgi:membrane protein DedA with SNARE-associated domain
MKYVQGEGSRVVHLSSEWGIVAYAGAAGWAFFEGETFVVLTAAAARVTCLVNPWLLIGAVWLGSYSGDQLFFILGRRWGVKAIRRIRGAEKHLALARRFIDRYGDLFVLAFRFVYGIRNVASAACGIAGMNHLRFAILNFIAAGIWAISFVTAGWYLGAWLGARGTAWAAALAGIVFVAVLTWKLHRNRRSVALERARSAFPGP